jgi:hypothetical protein
LFFEKIPSLNTLAKTKFYLFLQPQIIPKLK